MRVAVGEYDELVMSAANGNPAAADFLYLVVQIAQTWDDLIDRDKPVADGEINHAFEAALVLIPSNPFYRLHSETLGALLHNSIRNWHLATRIEREQETALLPAAFVLRSAYADIFAQVAYITGGAEYALTVAMAARRQAHAEGLDGYILSLAIERKARGG